MNNENFVKQFRTKMKFVLDRTLESSNITDSVLKDEYESLLNDLLQFGMSNDEAVKSIARFIMMYPAVHELRDVSRFITDEMQLKKINMYLKDPSYCAHCDMYMNQINSNSWECLSCKRINKLEKLK